MTSRLQTRTPTLQHGVHEGLHAPLQRLLRPAPEALRLLPQKDLMKDFEENWYDAHGTDLPVEQATAATQSGETDILAHHHTQDIEE